MNAYALRGLYRWEVEATAATGLRFNCKVIGAVDKNGKPESQQIIFTRNTSEALNLVASSLGQLCTQARR